MMEILLAPAQVNGLDEVNQLRLQKLLNVYASRQPKNQLKDRYYEGHVTLGEVNLVDDSSPVGTIRLIAQHQEPFAREERADCLDIRGGTTPALDTFQVVVIDRVIALWDHQLARHARDRHLLYALLRLHNGRIGLYHDAQGSAIDAFPDEIWDAHD